MGIQFVEVEGCSHVYFQIVLISLILLKQNAFRLLLKALTGIHLLGTHF